MRRAFVITLIPSPYQVELFDRLARDGLDLRVGYLRRTLEDRQWAVGKANHALVVLEDAADLDRVLAEEAGRADLVVFSNYSDPAVRRLMRRRERERRPWCFWGERPGFRGLGILGAAWRHWRLAPLHRS